MKNRILISVFICVLIGSSTFSNDFEKYKQAYEYIKQNSEVISTFSKTIKKKNKLCVTLSDEIVYIGQSGFENEIMNYEFSTLDSLQKIKAKDSLLASWMGGYESYHMQELNNLDSSNNCKLILFFSKVYGNRLFGIVCMRYKKTKDYWHNKDWGSLFMEFLFYFNEDQINQVFSKVLLQ